MTTAQLLASCRSLLDESSPSFYQNSEIYSWLNDAQREVANTILALYKAKLEVDPKTELPEVLISLQSIITGSASSPVAVPSDYLFLINMQLENTINYPCFIKQEDKKLFFESGNTFLQPTTTNPQVVVRNSGSGKELVFTPNTGTYAGTYLRIPPDISDAVDPILPDTCKSALIQFAYSRALLKDQNHQEAIAAYQQFLQMTQELY